MKPLPLFILLLLASACFAQEEEELETPTHEHRFNRGTNQYLFADCALLRSKPGTGTKVLATLPIEQEVTIIDEVDKLFTVRGT